MLPLFDVLAFVCTVGSMRRRIDVVVVRATHFRSLIAWNQWA